jgi:hypothetical protein
MHRLPQDLQQQIAAFCPLAWLYRTLRCVCRSTRCAVDAWATDARAAGDGGVQPEVLLISMPRDPVHALTLLAADVNPVGVVLTPSLCRPLLSEDATERTLQRLWCARLRAVYVYTDPTTAHHSHFVSLVCRILDHATRQVVGVVESLEVWHAGPLVSRRLLAALAALIASSEGSLRRVALRLPALRRVDVRSSAAVVQALQRCSRLRDVTLDTGECVWYHRKPGLLLGSICGRLDLRHLAVTTSVPVHNLRSATRLVGLHLRLHVPANGVCEQMQHLDRAIDALPRLCDLRLDLHQGRTTPSPERTMELLRRRPLRRLSLGLDAHSWGLAAIAAPNAAAAFTFCADWCADGGVVAALGGCLNPHLELRLRYSNLPISAYRGLGRLLACPGRHTLSLDLAHGRMGVAVGLMVAEVVPALDLWHLELGLEDNGVDDRAAADLAGALRTNFPALRTLELRLSQNRVSSSGVDELVRTLCVGPCGLHRLALGLDRMEPVCDASVGRWASVLAAEARPPDCTVVLDSPLPEGLPRRRGLLWQGR